MVTVTFIKHDGEEQELQLEEGQTLMQGAVDNGVDGIVGDCGGACACATCHCYIDEPWRARLGEANPIEAKMLECAMGPNESSRLSCQIDVSSDMAGLVVHLPKSQF